MSSSTLYRVSGGVLLLGGLLLTIGTLLQPSGHSDALNPLWLPAYLLSFIGAILVITSIPGLYARVSSRTGILGLIGFAMVFISGLLLGIGGFVIDLIIVPYVTQVAPNVAAGHGPPAFGIYFPVAGIMQTIGAILFGIALIRAAVLPGWTRIVSIVFIVGAVVNFASNFINAPAIVGNIGIVLFFLSFAAYGFALISQREAESARSVPATAQAQG